MKNKKLWLLAVLAITSLLVVAACAPQDSKPAEEVLPTVETMGTEAEAVPTETEMESAAEEPATETEGSSSAALTDDEMIALITEKLAGKHPINRVLDAEKTREEWESTLDRMIGYGAKINAEEKTLIIDWLLNR